VATPLARIGEPDIAGIVPFLHLRNAGSITGRSMVSDGGVTQGRLAGESVPLDPM
jgi:hypothetical protein